MNSETTETKTPVQRFVMPIGTRETPHKVAPADWDENGLDYGAFCECALCHFVGRSTFVFDYYADGGAGSALMCERCKLGVSFSQVKPVIDLLESQGHFEA